MVLMQQETDLAFRHHSPLCLQVQAFTPQQPNPKIKSILEKACLKQTVIHCHLLLSGVQEQQHYQGMPGAGMTMRLFGQQRTCCDGFAPAEIYFKVISNKKIVIFLH